MAVHACVVELLVWSWGLTKCKLQSWDYTSSEITNLDDMFCV